MGTPHTPCRHLISRMPYYKARRRIRWMDILGLRNTCQKTEKWWKQGLASTFVISLVAVIYLSDSLSADSGSHLSNYGAVHSSRRLLAENETHTEGSHGPAWEQCDYEKEHSQYAWLFNHIFFVLVIFIGIAIVCDDFFVPSLEIISEKLKLSEDVAGATFMAAGSSAPELFSSVAGVAVESDVGVGTIVGSAVFNLLIIIALTAALAGQILLLDWRPLMRDAFFYAMSIGCFIGFAWDGEFTHYESAILLVLYILYIVLMVFNPRLMEWMGTWRCACMGPKVEPVDEEPGKPDNQINGSTTKIAQERKETLPFGHLSLTGGHARRVTIVHMIRKASLSGPGAAGNEERAVEHTAARQFVHHQRGSIAGVLLNRKSEHHHEHPEGVDEHGFIEGVPVKEEEEDEEEEEQTIQICPCCPCCPAVRTWPPSSETVQSEGGCMNWFKYIFKWLLFIPAFPFVCLYSWTIPNCSKEHLKKWYVVSFLMSVLWIALLSFGMVTLVGRAGCILNVDSYIMGLVVVAVGTSIPDALSSVLVARDGYGDMAVSNAIGSNVFDINLGLGLPFLIRIAVDRGKPISLLDDTEAVDLATGHMPLIQHAKFGFILLIILVIALFVFLAARFRLNRWIGISFVIMYVLFLAYAFTQELYCIRTLEIYC